MPDLVQVETALRLAGERFLLSPDRQQRWSGGLPEIAAALVLLCELPRDVAEAVLDDYAWAQSFRRGGPPHLHAHRAAIRQHGATAPPALAPPVVVPCNLDADLPDGRGHIGSVVFTGTACEISVRYDGVPTWHQGRRRYRGGAMPPSGPPQLTVTDDQGTVASAHFSGGGSDDGWHGRWTTDRPLSTTTRWLDVSGTRVELGSSAAPATVRIEALPDEPLAHRYLWHRLALPDHGPADPDSIAEVLVELGVVDAADPVLDEIAQVAQALQGAGHGARPTRIREPWQSLVAGRRRGGSGPAGDVPLAAATPEFDATVVVAYDLRSAAEGFTVQVRVFGDGATTNNPFHQELQGVPLAWWAHDDRGNVYLGHWGSHSGGPREVTGQLGFYPAIDAKARRLALMPTGLHHRAVIDVELPQWGGAS